MGSPREQTIRNTEMNLMHEDYYVYGVECDRRNSTSWVCLRFDWLDGLTLSMEQSIERG